MSIFLLTFIFLAYIGLLFFIAWFGDRYAKNNKSIQSSRVIYSLALAVYCSSWTFYGAVGQASTNGWVFLSLYLGPILLLLFGWRWLKKIARLTKEKRLTSVADFIATRYGRSPSLGILVTWVAILAAIPYIALQLKAISMAFDFLTGLSDLAHRQRLFWQDTAFYISIIMAAFAILFGTRNTDASKQHPGLILAMAFESIVKLVAFLVVGIWVAFYAFDSPASLVRSSMSYAPDHPLFSEPGLSIAFMLQILLAAFAFIGLPRQFQMNFVEARRPSQLAMSRWLIPLYLLLMGVFVYPITMAGAALFDGQPLVADLLVLMIPSYFDQSWLTALAFLGGASAATGMIIIATLAISTMISNEWILPVFFKQKALVSDVYQSSNVKRLVLGVRRLAVVVLLLISYGFYRMTEQFEMLASFGLLSFSAVAQLAPALLGGILWRSGNRYGALAGLITGIVIWLYTLFWPMFSQTFLQPPTMYRALNTPFDGFTTGVLLSLGGNLVMYVVVSLFTNTNLRERLLASEFTSNDASNASALTPHFDCTVEDISEALSRVLGIVKTDKFFKQYALEFGYQFDRDTASHHLVRESEKLLASVVGASSARLIFTTLLGGEQVNIRDITLLASEASQAQSLSQEQLKAALENLSEGVSVLDKNLNIVAWNKRYIDLYDYPEGFLYSGKPVHEIIAFNCRRGFCGEGDVQAKVDRRIERLRFGRAHEYERRLPTGIVISMKGHSMPDGGYVTSFTDVTAYRNAEKTLKQANIVLEKRVERSTQQLVDLTEKLIEANAQKSNILAETSHDLIQPLNAAKLFASTLAQHRLDADQRDLMDHLEGALQSAEDVLSVLVEISKLDAGVMEPTLRPVNIGQVLTSLQQELQPIAQAKGLSLRYHGSDLWGLSDAHWLRRVVQNLLSNAIRYTQQGGVLLSCRQRQGQVCIEVWDTGPGIPENRIDEMFVEFKRLKQHAHEEDGLGLGLAIVDRMTKKMQHPLSVNSRVGTGTRFQLFVSMAGSCDVPESKPTEVQRATGGFEGLNVFCIDNDPESLMALKALLESWQCKVFACHSKEEAEAYQGQPDIMLADYQLDHGDSGLDVMTALSLRIGPDVPGVLISAAADLDLPDMTKERGFYFLKKPLKPAALRALIRRLVG